MADETKETILFDLKVDEDTKSIDNMTVSIASLTEVNKKLREERKNVDLQTEQGKARIKEINDQLDKNNIKIKENVSALEKQKINIGNYTGALDKLVPGLGATANGFQGMKTAAMAFIATPIGAVIGALGLAVGALTAYFKGSEEGQDRLTKVVNIGSKAFDILLQGVEKVGEVIFDTFEKGAELVGRFVDFIGLGDTSLVKFVRSALDSAEELTKVQDEVDARENELIVRRAETNKKVSELRKQAIKEEGDQKRALIAEAIRLEEELSKEETFQTNERLRAFEESVKAKGRLTEEEKTQRAELTAAIINAENLANENTFKLRKELQNLDEEIAKEAEIKKQRALDLVDIQNRANEADQVSIDLIKEKTIESDLNYQKSFINAQKSLDSQVLASNKQIAQAKKESDDKIKLDYAVAQAKSQNLLTVFDLGSQLLKEGSITAKAAAIGSVLVSTIQAATAALAPPPLGLGPVFGPIVAGLVTTLGAASVGKIAGIKLFAGGGHTGNGMGRRDETGFRPAGIVHEGEWVAPKWMTQSPKYSNAIAMLEQGRVNKYASGGYVDYATRVAIGDSNQSLMPQVQTVLVLEEVEFKQMQKSEILSRARIQ